MPDYSQCPHVNRIVLHGAWHEEATDSLHHGSLTLASGRIVDATDASNRIDPLSPGALEIDLRGLMLMPGLINAHDHLQYALHSRIGKPPYKNYLDWGEDIHQSCVDAIARPKLVPKNLRLWWGGVRNLLCGVTTVCHHDPLWPALLDPAYPIKIVRNYGWAHSVGLAADLKNAYVATSTDSPFIVHACEGVDEVARRELCDLERLGILNDRTVVVHGLAIDESGAMLMRKRHASLILCPSSNQFLFGCLPARHVVREIELVAIGNDSPLTAVGDLLDEVHFAIEHCGIAPEDAFSMITSAAATLLRLRDGQGTIDVHAIADLIAVRDTGETPARRIRTLSWKDIELVMVAGSVQLASNNVRGRLPDEVCESLEPLVIDGEVRWLRAPIQQMIQVSEAALGTNAVTLGGRPIATLRYDKSDKALLSQPPTQRVNGMSL